MTNPTVLGTGGHSAGGHSYLGTYYSNVGLGRSAMEVPGFTTESYVSQIIRVPGTISYLSWSLDNATFDAALTLTLKVNSSSSALAISIPEMTSGWVTDSTDSVTVSSGDALDFAADVEATEEISYSGSFFCVSARFDADSSAPANAQLFTAVGPSQISPTATRQFVNFLGVLGGGDLTESDQQFLCLAAGVWQNMVCHIKSNTFNQSTTINNRITNTNGSMAISVPASTTGSFEDTTHNDSVSVDDLLDYGFIVGSSGPRSGNLTMDWIGAHFLATDAGLCVIGGATDLPVVIVTTDYSSLFGGGNVDTTTPRSTGLFPCDLTASNFTNYLTAATQTPIKGAATFKLLKNGTSVLAASSTSGQSGYWSDTAAASFSRGDTCANEITVTAGGVTWANATVLLDTS